MLALMAHSYSECTYKVSGFHAAFGDKLQLNENLAEFGVCPSSTDVEQQLSLYGTC